ncbi:BON domain-containing protein [Neorhizobium lilium]|uniref:BON domain-containing protein n=1 Tax=Neorhizobium lilium TaxID=2503024 RepID=A0A444LJS4_9HYPH|nr:BON domain-containing protein [Neorhizobium lilium]RWX79258.1 BON domain-containing protein [Neorhizobium lilium]
MVYKHQHFHETTPEVETEFPPAAVLEGAVSDALASAGGIDATDVTVTATGSVITLAGSVLQTAEITRAEEVTRSVPGVTEVRNSLDAKTNINEARGI